MALIYVLSVVLPLTHAASSSEDHTSDTPRDIGADTSHSRYQYMDSILNCQTVYVHLELPYYETQLIDYVPTWFPLSSHPTPVQDTLGYLLTASGDPNVQGLAGVLPKTILESKADVNSQGHVHQLAEWKQWADTNPGMDVFPVKPSHLCQYLTHLVDTDGHEAAIADVREAMTWVHSLVGYISPVDDPLVDTCLTRLQGES